MKALRLFPVLFFALVALSCGNKQKGKAASSSSPTREEQGGASAAVSEVVEKDSLMPVSLFYKYNNDYIQVSFWTVNERPDSVTFGWKLQQLIRRNADKYTCLIKDGRAVRMKFVGETLCDPDGGLINIGQTHSTGRLSAGLNYEVADNDKKTFGRHDNGVYALVTDSFLSHNKLLGYKQVKEVAQNMPSNIVSKLEGRYKMSAVRSLLTCKIGGRWSFGAVQFKPVGEKVLALQVLTDGKRTYVSEEWGVNDKEYGPTWNVDDDGIYLPTTILAAFKTCAGRPMLCYVRQAPESVETGYLTPDDDGTLEKQEVSGYYVYIDEPIILYKTQAAQLQKLADEFAEVHGVESTHFTHFRYCYIDDDDIPELVLRNGTKGHRCVFLMKGDPKVIGLEDNYNDVEIYNGVVCMKDVSQRGSFNFWTYYIIKHSSVEHTINMVSENYYDRDEDMYKRRNDISIDHKDMTQEAFDSFEKKFLSNGFQKDEEFYWRKIGNPE